MKFVGQQHREIEQTPNIDERSSGFHLAYSFFGVCSKSFDIFEYMFRQRRECELPGVIIVMLVGCMQPRIQSQASSSVTNGCSVTTSGVHMNSMA